MNTQSGYIAIVGRPNVGKSTLLNALLGQKISIISPKPQTTRHNLLGIKTLDNKQLIFVDTPGLQISPQKALNRIMNKNALGIVQDVDVIVFVVEGMQWRDEDEWVLQRLKNNKVPVILVVNKVDKISPRERLLPFLQKMTEKYNFAAICPLSAKDHDNLDGLEQEIISRLPENDFIFSEDQLTDKSERFLVAELIREKLMLLLGEELPYQTTVEIEQFVDEQNITKISGLIWVERDGQKAIVIGKGGSMLKKIGSQARQDIEKLLDKKVFLQLWVKVKADWSDNDRALRQLGYSE
jgi:GTPase